MIREKRNNRGTDTLDWLMKFNAEIREIALWPGGFLYEEAKRSFTECGDRRLM